jgi:hypothetical protein
MSLKCNRKGFLTGIPRRDLTDAEVEKYGGAEFLLSTGLYEREGRAAIVNQYFAPAIINVGTWDEIAAEQQEPAAAEDKPKRKTKKGKLKDSLTEG